MANSHDMDLDDDRDEDTPPHRVSPLHHEHAPREGSRPLSAEEESADDDARDYYSARKAPVPFWEKAARQVRFWFRTAAVIFFACFFVGWPVGTSLSAYRQTGLFAVHFGLSPQILAVVIGLTAIIVVLGQLLFLCCRMVAKAEELETSASRFSEPETHAVTNVRSVGKAVRSEISALNTYLDQALVKLASAESMIRQQVQAIDTVGTSLRNESGSLAGSVARERENLIALTEMMNTQADAFAEAIAEKAKLGEDQSRLADEKISEAETEIQARLTRLEDTAEKALKAFEVLATAFEERRRKVEETGSAFDQISSEAAEKSVSVTKAFQENTEAVSAAQKRLEEESERLEHLITQQRERADKLAEAIAKQTDKLDSLSQKRARKDSFQSTVTPRVRPGFSAPTSLSASLPAAAFKASRDHHDRARPGLSLTGISGFDDTEQSRDGLPNARPGIIRSKASPSAMPLKANINGLQYEIDQEPGTDRPAAGSGAGSGSEPLSARRDTPLQDDEDRASRDRSGKQEQRREPPISASPLSSPPHSSPADTPRSRTPDPSNGRLQPPAQATTREERQSTSWRDILAKAEKPAQPEPKNAQSQLGLQHVSPADPTPPASQRETPRQERQEPPAGDSDIVWLIRQMQSFMVEIETRLYGKPDMALLTRYKNGERNIFAHTLLQRDDYEFSRKLKNEVDRNEVFERAVFDFLANFDALLEPGDEDEDDGLIDDYLGSPLGQIYVHIGSALDYFG